MQPDFRRAHHKSNACARFCSSTTAARAYNRDIVQITSRILFLASTATALERTTVSRPSNLFFSREKRTTVLCLSLVLLVLAFYNPVVHNSFTNMDDDSYITENAHVKAGLTWDTVKWSFTSLEVANWHPVTWLSHALDCQIFGLSPVGHHYVNVLIHAANVLLLFLLLQSATGLTWPSFMVAGLFALHPINVESVAWASERKNTLSMFFLLLTMHAYQRYVRETSVKRYLAIVFLFALGLMAKPEIITLPFILLLWDYWPLRRMFAGSSSATPEGVEPRSFSYLFAEKLPLLALSAGSAVITMIAQSRGDAVRGGSAYVRGGNALTAYLRYLGKAFWPTRLSAMYPHLGRFLRLWQVLAAAAALIAITTIVLRLRKHRYLPVGWFWFLGTLIPVIGLIQVGVQSMADRYAYLSFIGLFIAIVWGAAEIVRARRLPPALVAVPAALILGTLGMVTRKQITYWHDSVSLWNHAIDVTQYNYFAHNAIGYALAQRGQVDAAIYHFDTAERLHMYEPLDLMALAAYKRAHGHIPEAIEEYGRALAQSSDPKMRSLALSRLSSVFLQIGDIGRAKGTCAQALKENPKNGSAWVGAGLIAEREGDFKSAAEQISKAMNLEPTPVGYLLLADVLRRSGLTQAADEAEAQARHIAPDIRRAQQDVAEVLVNSGINPDGNAASGEPILDPAVTH